MNTKINLIKLAFGCMVGGTLFFSCKREEANLSPNQSTITPVKPKDLFTEQKILAFKQRCKFYYDNPGIKTGGLIGLDEAVWDMEAALNYTFSHSNSIASGQHVKTTEIPLATANPDSVDFTAVTDSYYKMIDSLIVFYNSLSIEGKRVILMDVCKDTTVSSGPQKLKMTCVIGPGDAVTTPADNPFTASDYWYYGFLQGKCGPYFGTVNGSDAAREIEKLQGPFKLPQIPGYHLYYTDIEIANVIGDVFVNPDDSVQNDNMYDYMMFNNRSNLPNFHECLSPEEMNFYFHSTYFVLTDPGMVRAYTNPPQKTFIALNLSGVSVPLINYVVVSHFAEAQYGFPHYSYDPCFPVSDPSAY